MSATLRASAPITTRWDGPGEDLRGFVFGQLTVEAPAPIGERGMRVAARCACGRIAVRHVVDLTSGAARACVVCRPAEQRLRPVKPQRSPDLPPLFRDPAIVARFVAKTVPEPNTGCVFWLARVDRDGYGQFAVHDPEQSRRAGKQRQYHLRAARFALAMHLDRWPRADLIVIQGCDMPGCVNPEHLREGTVAQAQREMVAKGRLGRRGYVPPEKRPRGDRHPNTKISDADVAKILRRRKRGEELQHIADDYRVHVGTITSICLGRSPRVARLGLKPVKLRELRRRAAA